jgi:hypothetical protein
VRIAAVGWGRHGLLQREPVNSRLFIFSVKSRFNDLLLVLRRSTVAVERTLSIIMPDAVAKNVIGKIITRFEDAGLSVIAGRVMQLTRAQAEGFYAVHRHEEP